MGTSPVSGVLPAAASLNIIGDDTSPANVAAVHDQNVQSLNYLLQGGLQLQSNLGMKLLSVPVTAPDTQWIDISSTLGYLNSWSNARAGGYLMLPWGEVVLRGTLTGGTVNTGATGNMFILPSGYAPNQAAVRIVESNGTSGIVLIGTDGSVRAYSGNNASMTLDGLSWRAAQPAAAPRRFNVQGPGGTQGVQGWPIVVKHGLKAQCRGVVPLAILLSGGQSQQPIPEPGAAMPMPMWDITPDDGQGNLQINWVFGLSPGKMYNATLLALSG